MATMTNVSMCGNDNDDEAVGNDDGFVMVVTVRVFVI